MNIGIDKMDFYTPAQYLDLVDLAQARKTDPNKYLIGIGQRQMAIPSLDQDAVVLAANAAEKILSTADRQQIGLLIVATESGVDQSKAAALFVQQLLQLSPYLRAIELKEACYGGTAGLQLARDFVAQHPQQKALVLASDIARYGLQTSGEVTQGAGAVALLVSANPRILAIAPDSVYQSQNVNDFWRPNYSQEAMARGKFSEEVYLKMFQNLWTQAQAQKLWQPVDLQALLCHLPFSKMGLKAVRSLQGQLASVDYERLMRRFQASVQYGRVVGNIYTGSLYLSLISLLDHDTSLQAGDQLACYSYGSGAVAELFTGTLVAGFQEQLHPHSHQKMLAQRQRLTIAEYEAEFQQQLVTDGSTQELTQSDPTAPHYLTKVEAHQRFYV